MKTRLLHWWDVLNSSYWFVPSVMLAFVIALATFTLWLDGTESFQPKGLGWIYTGGA